MADNRSSGPIETSSMEDMSLKVVRALTMFTCVWGIVGNSLVTWLLCCRVQGGPVGVYVLNRAVADLLFLLCMMVLMVLHAEAWKSSVSPWALLATRSTQYLAYMAGLALLVTLTIQHYLSILIPRRYTCHRPRHLPTLVCTLLWVLCFLLAVLISSSYQQPWQEDSKEDTTVDTTVHILTLAGLMPAMILFGVFSIQAHRNPRQWHQQPWRLLVGLLASVLVFLVCSLPLFITSVLLYWVPLPPQMETLLDALGHLALSVNSSVNPFIYFLVGNHGCQRLWEPLETVLSRALQEKPQAEGRPMPSTGTKDKGPQRKA